MLDGPLQRALRDREQFLDPLVDHPDRNRRRRVPHPAVLHNADVELHDVAILNAALTADAVHDLVVQRNADVARENAMTKAIPEKRALHTGILHEIGGGLVDFLRRNRRAESARSTRSRTSLAVRQASRILSISRADLIGIIAPVLRSRPRYRQKPLLDRDSRRSGGGRASFS